MDSKTFDALARGFGSRRTRRDALTGIAAGLFGLGAAKAAAAQGVVAQRAICGADCRRSRDCNSGFRCGDGSGRCVAIQASGDNCNNDNQCSSGIEVCRGGECVTQVNCVECFENDDCGRNGRCRRDGTCR